MRLSRMMINGEQLGEKEDETWRMENVMIYI